MAGRRSSINPSKIVDYEYERRQEGPDHPMVRPVFGTAHLFATVSTSMSRQLLHAASATGFRAFDTAPSYGYGASEPAVGELVRDVSPSIIVTTKVGLLPAVRPGPVRRMAKAAARSLPGTVQKHLRRPQQAQGSGTGRFGVIQVRSSIEESLRRLGHIDRLLLHEVAPDDIDDELRVCLAGYVARGDVDVLGTATANELTAQCLARAPELFSAAHVAIGVDATAVEFPATVTVRVGHGILGPGGRTLRRMAACRDADPDLQIRWRAATQDSRWDGPNGLADALIARAVTSGVTDAIVATSRLERVSSLYDLVSSAEQPPGPVLTLVEAFGPGQTSD